MQVNHRGKSCKDSPPKWAVRGADCQWLSHGQFVGALRPQSGNVRFLEAVIRCLNAVTHDKQTNKQTNDVRVTTRFLKISIGLKYIRSILSSRECVSKGISFPQSEQGKTTKPPDALHS